jgi:hypothetical protein
VLSDHEQRTLDELERSLAADPFGGTASAGPPGRFRGSAVVGAALACICVALLLTGVPAAALAIATAAGIGWLFWWLWSRRDGAAGPGQRGARRRPGESIRQFLRWLAEAE